MTNQKRQMSLPRPSAGEDPIRYMEQMRQLAMDEFNRLADDFYKFRADVEQSGGIALNAPSMVTAVGTEYGVTVTWENPGAQPIDPTEVMIRIVGVTPWASFSYPKSSWTFSGLLPATTYTVEVKLVARYETVASYSDPFRTCPVVPVQRTAESNAQPRTFRTIDGVGPPVNGTGGNIIFSWPPSDNPGIVGSGNCWWEYGFQAFSIVGDTTVVWTDVGSLTEFDGDITSITVDTTLDPPFTPGTIYRIKYREVCNSIPGVWRYTLGFPVVDWSLDCAGVETNVSLSSGPYNVADLWAIPAMCLRTGENLVVVDALSETALSTHADGLAATFYAGGDGEWTLLGDAGPSATAISGELAAIAGMNDITDYSFWFELFPTNINFEDQPQELLKIADIITVTATPRNNASIWGVTQGLQLSVTVPLDGNQTMVAVTANAVPNDEWSRVAVIVRAGDGTSEDLCSIDVYVNGVLVDTVTRHGTLNFFGATTAIKVSLFDQLLMRKFYGWNSVVIPDPPYTLDDVGTKMVALGAHRYWPMVSTEPFGDFGSNPGDIDTTVGSPSTVAADDGENYAYVSSGNNFRAPFNNGGEIRKGGTAASSQETTVVVFLKPDASTGAQTIYSAYDGSWFRGSVSQGGDSRTYITGTDSVTQTGIDHSRIYHPYNRNLLVAGDWKMYVFQSRQTPLTEKFRRDDTYFTGMSLLGDADLASVLDYAEIGGTYAGGIAHMAIFHNPGLTDAQLDEIYVAAQGLGWFL